MIKNELFEAKRFQDAQLLVKEVEAGIQRSPEVMEDVLAIMQRNDENLQAWMSILTKSRKKKGVLRRKKFLKMRNLAI